MHLQICHRTLYRYEGVLNHATQIARLTPRPSPGLNVIRWQVKGHDDRKPLTTSSDGFGNILHIQYAEGNSNPNAILVQGEVETSNTNGIIGKGYGSLPPSFYLRTTGLTKPTNALVELAQEVPFGPILDRLHHLMDLVHSRIDYRSGATDVTTTADQSLARGAGVCQDHAHVFICCARILGIPARYVSGYLWAGADAQEDASHAWAEAWTEDLGWVGFDPANGNCPGEAYVRTAIALDYWSAAPIRGIWRGTGHEHLDVSVRVQASQVQQ